MPIHKARRSIARKTSSRRSQADLLAPIAEPELVFGLVAPIGTDLTDVSKKLEEELLSVGYIAVNVHVTDTLKQFRRAFRLRERPIEERYRTHMDAGNALRKRLGRQDAFALLSVVAVRRGRLALSGHRRKPHPKTAYILNQFKRPEEIQTLRRIYGRGFAQISAYCSKEKRIDSLTDLIASSHHRQRQKESYKGKAQDLVSRDDVEEENFYGQRLRDTFPLADVVINADSEEKTKETCARFVRAMFGDNFCTPTPDEYGMYLARAASLRSADLSRQVGAAIARGKGEIITLGCNEVPRAGGGAYWENDEDDYRDFRVGYDSSVKAKKEILEDLFRRLKTARWLSRSRLNKEINDLINEALAKDGPGALRDAQVMDSLEFGRIVHAEMMAITAAARLGISLDGCTLYCTTFPCHICARHIVASGIRRVVYIEPYSKSLASELYPDSIEVEGQVKRPGAKVHFEPFIGIAPERFTEIFRKSVRKGDGGEALKWEPATAKPVLQRLIPAYIQIESAVAGAARKMLVEAGLQVGTAKKY